MPQSSTRRCRAASVLARVTACLLFACASAAQAASLDPALLPAIQAATFEVVAAKPAEGGTVYEKPLPMDLIPFQERNDKYHSIGTAFAVEKGRYITAAHVLMSGMDSHWGPPALRDGAGRVYAIDKIHKFSLEQDFVMFTLAEAPPTQAVLPIDPRAQPGQSVFSVGNAYGTGIVVRDGLYTSDTPEQQDGRWKWMRFSAAASPGNSGGPLVEGNGKVIGVVMAKSPNENLNFALPIDQVMAAPENLARVDVRAIYQFDVFDAKRSSDFKTEFTLPLTLHDFFAVYSERSSSFMQRELDALLAQERERLFPRGDGSQQLLHRIAWMENFPLVVARGDNGVWTVAGDKNEPFTLGANGHLTFGSYGKNTLFYLRRPDDVPAHRLYGEPAELMGLLLKTGFLKRPIGGDNVMVTSLGKPTSANIHTDAWGRRWRAWEWAVPYANATVIMMALPVPDGYIGLTRVALPTQLFDQRINAKALTDFVYVNYDGTLAQWKEFLAQPELHPKAFDTIRIDFDYGQRFSYASSRLRIRFDSALQAIKPDSMLTLGFSFYQDHGRPVWDVAQVWASAKGTDSNYLAIVRDDAPPASLGDDYANDWNKVVQRRHPYDGAPRSADQTTKISTVIGPPAEPAPEVLYTAHLTREGAQPEEAMRAALAELTDGVEMVER